MNFYRYSIVLKVIVVISSSNAFDILKADVYNRPKRLFGRNILLRIVRNCAFEWQKWGVTYNGMIRYSSKPRKWPEYDNDIYDCAFGCFFQRMGWLDDEDLESAYQPLYTLEDLEQYIVSERLTYSERIASRCVHLNYPYKDPGGHVPTCGQARRLKNCLISEVVLKITKKNKRQFAEMMRDWMKVCADLEGFTVAEVLDRAAHPPAAPPKDIQPALQGCVWRCLFDDMGMIKEDEGLFVLPVVRETIKLYYPEKTKKRKLLKIATKCVFMVNHKSFTENGDIEDRPHGCDRSQYMVDCLMNNFFKNNTSFLNQWIAEEKGIGRIRNRPPASAQLPPRTRPPPRGRAAHLLRSRLRTSVAQLEPSDSVVVKVSITES